ncbi:Vacuolar protein sorting 55 [Trinorchestia longiramus]|nr:Vacuolar protein sorting 55 [Trinorchestia longiramus]
MAGIKALVTLAFLASLGVMFLILACALPRYNNWWPLFVLLFYVLAPLPNICNRSDSSSNTSPRREFGWFITSIIVVSAFALPIVLARVGTIQWGACWLVLAGDVVTFLTIFGFVVMADSDDIEYSMW